LYNKEVELNKLMLSNISIKQYLESGDIIINPWNDDMMGASRITLYLGEQILIPDKETVVDVKRNIIPQYETIALTDNNPFSLKPDMFVLGETYEEIGLSQKVGMLLEGRSTLARLGITVVQTAMIIDTGQKPKKMTLEIRNNGYNTVLLYPRMKFCRACFFLLNPSASIRYDSEGKYKPGDENIPKFKNEIRVK
jgi:dCTP deaminase